MRIHKISTGIGLALCAGLALASDPLARADSERERARAELRAAQAELDRVAAKMAELASRMAREEANHALAHRGLGRPVLGVVLQEDPDSGVRLAGVTPEGPASRAGLAAGDRIIEIKGKAIGRGTPEQRLERARELIGTPSEGEKIRITYQRDGKTHKADVAAATLPGLAWLGRGAHSPEALADRLRTLAAPRAAFDVEHRFRMLDCDEGSPHCVRELLVNRSGWPGLRLARVDKALGRYFGTERGVLVLRQADEPAQLQSGDVLLQVDRQDVDAPEQVMRALQSRAPGEPVQLRLLRDRRELELQVPAPALARLPLLAPPPPPTPPAPPAMPAPPSPAAAPQPPPPPAAPLAFEGEPRLQPTPRPAAAPRTRGVIEQVLER